MARRLVAQLGLVAAAALCVAHAQTLQRLTVESFVLNSDAARPRVDVPFHLIVTLRVRERVPEIDNLQLPILAQLELLGDERQTVSGPRGTQYREVITVVAHSAGTLAIAPATLQAIDARDGKPKEWFSNPLTLEAGVPASQIIHDGGAAILAGAVILLRLLLVVIGAAFVVGVAILLVRRANRTVPVPPVTTPTVAPRPRTRAELIGDALVVLRTERTRAAATRVRGAVWRMLGASEGETLGDVLRRPGTRDPAVREMLVGLERSAFTYDADLQGAIEDACGALERYASALG